MLLRLNSNLDFVPTWGRDWSNALSPGELQRLAFLRVFYHKPAVALVDEATSALDLDLEEELMEECEKLEITLVSVGHRKSLRKFHDKEVGLGLAEGSWLFQDIDKEN